MHCPNCSGFDSRHPGHKGWPVAAQIGTPPLALKRLSLGQAVCPSMSGVRLPKLPGRVLYMAHQNQTFHANLMCVCVCVCVWLAVCWIRVKVIQCGRLKTLRPQPSVRIGARIIDVSNSGGIIPVNDLSILGAPEVKVLARLCSCEGLTFLCSLPLPACASLCSMGVALHISQDNSAALY
jgi:hypothetical protein